MNILPKGGTKQKINIKNVTVIGEWRMERKALDV
jgi:hypothetical protein